MNRLQIICAVVFAGSYSTQSAQAESRPTAFTTQQAEAGRSQLHTNSFGDCSLCHTSNLGGRSGVAGELPAYDSLSADYQKLIDGNGGYVPDLVGAKFRERWANRSTKELTAEFLDRFSGVKEATRLDLIAYFLQSNGAEPGTQPLTMATDVKIGALVSKK